MQYDRQRCFNQAVACSHRYVVVINYDLTLIPAICCSHELCSDFHSRIRSWGDMSLPPQGSECTNATGCISQIVQMPVVAKAGSASLSVPTIIVTFCAVMVIAASAFLQ